MKKIISLVLIGVFLSGCSIFRVHKNDVDQGNVISQDNVHRIHKGMTEAEVTRLMGHPVLINVFSPHRLDYIYTFQAGHGTRFDTRVTCLFVNGRVSDVQTTTPSTTGH